MYYRVAKNFGNYNKKRLTLPSINIIMMKIITAILPILAALLLSCTSTDNDGNTFDIQLSGKGCNNLMARLYRETDSGLVIVDSARFDTSR